MEKIEKAPETPDIETEKVSKNVSEEEVIFDNPRSRVENLVIAKNAEFPEPEEKKIQDAPESKEEEPVTQSKKNEKALEEKTQGEIDSEELNLVGNLKDKIKKRIDKQVAKTKSLEEKLAEKEAEIERLRNLSRSSENVQTPKEDKAVTPEQVEAYIAQMQEEGNHKEAAAAIRYLVKLEKEQAIQSIRESEEKSKKEAEAQQAMFQKELSLLTNDYVVLDKTGKKDMKHDLTLENKSGLLYKTALSLYNDPELHADYYNDPNVIHGFRRAVADAYREIHQQGLIKNSPNEEKAVPEKRNQRFSLAEPDAEFSEENSSKNSNDFSAHDIVREEIKNRKKNRFSR